jgi:hypothetical protein
MAVGDPSNPLSSEGLIKKFMNQVEFSEKIARRDADKIVQMVEKLENIDNINKIFELTHKK